MGTALVGAAEKQVGWTARGAEEGPCDGVWGGGSAACMKTLSLNLNTATSKLLLLHLQLSGHLTPPGC